MGQFRVSIHAAVYVMPLEGDLPSKVDQLILRIRVSSAPSLAYIFA